MENVLKRKNGASVSKERRCIERENRRIAKHLIAVFSNKKGFQDHSLCVAP